MVFNLNPRASINEDRLQSFSHYGPVTSLKFLGDLILCGYGPTLKIFRILKIDEKFQIKLIAERQIFKRNKIHWIATSICGQKLFVAGGRSFAVLTLANHAQSDSSCSLHIEFKCEKAINEWIVCGEFLNDVTLLILTSHNIIYKVDITEESTGHFSLVSKIDCNEKSILYSGSIQIDFESQKAIVAAGTVMSGVIIWDGLTGKILHNLTDHKGSIFGAKIDPSFKYIISCSDDRSIKLYDFTSGEVLALGWGHGSRIWNLQFLLNSDSSLLKILSTGEDCTTRIWSYVDNSPDLEPCGVIDNCHSGKHVWSCDVDNDTFKLIVTGGNDGTVRLHDINEFESDFACPVAYSLQHISENSDITFSQPEVIKHFVEIKLLNYLICLTSFGQLFGLDQLTNKWQRIHLTDESKPLESLFKSFAIMKNIPNTNYVAICSINGDVLLLKFDKSSLTPIDHKWILAESLNGNKITNMLITFDNVHFNGQVYILLDSPNPKVPLIVHCFNSKSDSSSEASIDNIDTIELSHLLMLDKPVQNGFMSTYLTYDSTNNWLIVCSRFVGIMVYDLTNPSAGKYFRKVTDGDTITAVKVINPSLNNIQLLVIVRDGIYAFMTLCLDSDFKLQVTHQNRIFRGFVEGGYLHGDDLILYGFRSVYFYVWNETKQLEIMKVACGGSHRAWKFMTYNNDSMYKFIYISKSELVFKVVNNRFYEDYGLINNGTHGREIRDVAVSPKVNDQDNSRYIFSASEDTIVRVGKLFANGSIKYYWGMNYHVSGLQKIKFLNANFIASSAANEEFFIWKLTDNQLINNDIPLVSLYSVLKSTSDIPDLRVMDFDSIQVSQLKFLIVMVYSDSHIRVWEFDIIAKKFTKLIDDSYTTCCILNSKILRMNNCYYLLISATDGHITIWDINDKLPLPSIESITVNDNKINNDSLNVDDNKLNLPIIRQQLHQSGIKGLHINQTSDDCIKIITGGDDNALILSSLQHSKTNGLTWELNSFIEDGASSTITSICGDDDQHTILVTSVDQIVRLWGYSNNQLNLLSAKYTTVADPGCGDICNINNSNLYILAGVGLSVWKF